MLQPFRPTDATHLLRRIIEIFRTRGVSGYLVGGAVRDRLLGRAWTDLDLAVDGDALALGRALADQMGGSYVLLHEERGMARVVVPRGDDGPAISIDLTGMAGGIRQDLLRRDFTINAMAVPLDAMDGPDWDEDALIDPSGGRASLTAQAIRAVHPDVFQDDPLRLLRAVRLAAELGFTIAPESQTVIRCDAALLTTVAGERLHEELCRIFAAQGAAASVRHMDQIGLLEVLLPEVTAGRGVSQPKEHHWDVLDHNIETSGWLEAILQRGGCPSGRPDDPLDLVPWAPELDQYFAREAGGGQRRGTLLKLAGLLHDVAKPQTKGPDATGRIRFLGHPELGAEMCATILARLRFSSRETQAITTMVTYHLRPGQLATGWELPTNRALYRYFRDVGEVALDTLYLNLADHLAARGPNLEWAEWQAHTAVAAHILQRSLADRQMAAPPRRVTGHDVMAHFGIGPGPQVGRMVEAAHEALAAGDVTSREEALRYLEGWLEEDGGDER